MNYSMTLNKEKLFWIALGIYLFVLPISHTIAIRYLSFFILIYVTIKVLINEQRLPIIPFAKYWFFYFLIAFISVFFAVDWKTSLTEMRSEVIDCFIVFMIGVIWGGRYADFGRLAILLAVINLVLTLSASFVVSLDMTLDEIIKINPILYAGLNSNMLLIVLFTNAWLVLYFWNAKRKVFSYFMMLLMFLDIWAMLATDNRQNFIALGFGMAAGAMLLLRMQFSWKQFMVFFSLLFVVVLLTIAQMMLRTGTIDASIFGSISAITTTDVMKFNQVETVVGSTISSDVRWPLWRSSIEKIAEHPLIGCGIGRSVIERCYPDLAYWHAHNMILNRGMQMGVPGIVGFVTLWIILGLEMFKYANSLFKYRYLAVAGFSIVVTMFVKNMTDDFFVRNVALFFWIILGWFVGFLRSNEQSAQSA